LDKYRIKAMGVYEQMGVGVVLASVNADGSLAPICCTSSAFMDAEALLSSSRHIRETKDRLIEGPITRAEVIRLLMHLRNNYGFVEKKDSELQCMEDAQLIGEMVRSYNAGFQLNDRFIGYINTVRETDASIPELIPPTGKKRSLHVDPQFVPECFIKNGRSNVEPSEKRRRAEQMEETNKNRKELKQRVHAVAQSET
jgi:hypothetical protein